MRRGVPRHAADRLQAPMPPRPACKTIMSTWLFARRPASRAPGLGEWNVAVLHLHIASETSAARSNTASSGSSVHANGAHRHGAGARRCSAPHCDTTTRLHPLCRRKIAPSALSVALLVCRIHNLALQKALVADGLIVRAQIRRCCRAPTTGRMRLSRGCRSPSIRPCCTEVRSRTALAPSRH